MTHAIAPIAATTPGLTCRSQGGAFCRRVGGALWARVCPPLSVDLFTSVLPFPRIGGRLFTRADKKYTGRPRHQPTQLVADAKTQRKALRLWRFGLTGSEFIGSSGADPEGPPGRATGSRARQEAMPAGGRGRVRRWGGSEGLRRGCFRRVTGSPSSTGSVRPGCKWFRLVRVGPPKWLRLVTRGGGVCGARIPRRRGGTYARTGPDSAGRE